MDIGFTGTQEGMNDLQASMLTCLLETFFAIDSNSYFHHGDCIGADAQANQIADKIGYVVVVHPPVVGAKRAWCTATTIVMRGQYPYLERNEHIARESDIVLATPKEEEEEVRSGTWSTIRRAKGHCIVLYPSGRIEKR